MLGLVFAGLASAYWYGQRQRGGAPVAGEPAAGVHGPSAPTGREPATTMFANANLVLISIDTLRADHLGVYGYHRPTSPRLEDFARQSLVFERFYHSGGGTLDSHVSMMTSLRPLTHGITPASGRSLEQERVTLAETL